MCAGIDFLASTVTQPFNFSLQVISSLKRALQPSVTDLKLEFQVPKQYEVTQAPSKLPTLFNGDKVIMYGIFKPKSKGKSGQQLELGGIAILKGRVVDQPLEYTIPFQISRSDAGEMGGDSAIPIIHQLAAKSLIQDWQNGEGLHGLSADKTKKAIIDLSIEASVVSTHTAYIAVDEEQDKPIAGAIKTWDITAAMAEQEGRRGWRFGGRGGGGGGMMKNVAAARPRGKANRMGATMEMGLVAPQLPSLSFAEDTEFHLHGRLRSCKLTPTVAPPPKLMRRTVAPPPKLKPRTASDKHTSLISLQQAEGNWQFDSSLAGVLAKPLEKLESSCPVPCKGSILTIWATILALVFLEMVCASQRDEWELVAFKAEAWLQGQPLPSGVDMNTLREAARKSIF